MKKIEIDVNGLSFEETIEKLDSLFGKGENNIPLSGNSTKPTEKQAKAYLSVLIEANNDFISKQPQVKTLPTVSVSKEDKKRNLIREAKRKMENIQHVIIVNNNPINTLEDADGVIEYKTCGNTYTGFETFKVLFDKPWFLPELLIDGLREATYTPIVSDKKGVNGITTQRAIPRYNIQILSNPTQEEIDSWKVTQAARATLID